MKNERVLQTPLSAEAVSSLSVGDVFYLDGILVTARDAAHERYVCQGMRPQIDLCGGAVFHAGPIVKKDGDSYQIVAAGPTTSMRMEAYEADFIAQSGVRLLIGKGGMGEATRQACRKFGVIHAVIPGGCAVSEADAVEKVEGVEWLDLAMPEALWICRVRHFGPLIVSIDTAGNSLFARQAEELCKRKKAALEAFKTTQE